MKSSSFNSYPELSLGILLINSLHPIHPRCKLGRKPSSNPLWNPVLILSKHHISARVPCWIKHPVLSSTLQFSYSLRHLTMRWEYHSTEIWTMYTWVSATPSVQKYLFLDTFSFIHFDNKYFRTEGVYLRPPVLAEDTWYVFKTTSSTKVDKYVGDCIGLMSAITIASSSL